MARKRVLLVDDEPDDLEETKSTIEMLGYDVLTRQSTYGLLEEVRNARPSVVLQDAGMPGTDPARLVEAIKEDPETRKTPVILFSSTVDLDELAERCPVDAVLYKPFKMKELDRILEQMTASD